MVFFFFFFFVLSFLGRAFTFSFMECGFEVRARVPSSCTSLFFLLFLSLTFAWIQEDLKTPVTVCGWSIIKIHKY